MLIDRNNLAWSSLEDATLYTLQGKGWGVDTIAKALMRTEAAIRTRLNHLHKNLTDTKNLVAAFKNSIPTTNIVQVRLYLTAKLPMGRVVTPATPAATPTPNEKTRKMKKKISKKQSAAITKMFVAGTPAKELAKQYGVSNWTLYKAIPEQVRKQRVLRAQKNSTTERVLKLHKKGNSAREIATATGLKYSQVYWLLYKNGIKLSAEKTTKKRAASMRADIQAPMANQSTQPAAQPQPQPTQQKIKEVEVEVEMIRKMKIGNLSIITTTVNNSTKELSISKGNGHVALRGDELSAFITIMKEVK